MKKCDRRMASHKGAVESFVRKMKLNGVTVECARALAPLVVATALLAPFAQGQVKVWEDTLRIPSSEEGLPDENPPFDLFAERSFNYPYTLRQNIKDRRVPKDWRGVYFETEYVKCNALTVRGGTAYAVSD